MEDEEFHLKRNGAEAILVETWHDVPKQAINAVFKWDNPEDVPLRIGIVGAQGTAKTTLARRLCKTLEIPIIEEVARGAHDVGLRLNKGSDIVTQATIWLSQFYEQITVAEFVSDNTLLGHLCYLEWQAQKLDLGKDQFLFTCLKNLTHRVMHMEYTVVFYLPIDKPPVADGIRSVDKRFQQQIDQLILKNLDSLGVDYFPLLGTMNDKFKAAMAFLNGSGLLDERDMDN